MIFQTGHSTLVRLSDRLKIGVGNALETAHQSISVHRKRLAVLILSVPKPTHVGYHGRLAGFAGALAFQFGFSLAAHS